MSKEYRPAFSHGIQNYVMVAIVQSIVDLAHKAWNFLKDNPNSIYSKPAEFSQYILKTIDSFGELVVRCEVRYDDPAYLTDVDREKGVHVLVVHFQMHQAGDLYELAVRSDRPRTRITLCTRALGHVRGGESVNIYQSIFDDELGVKGWRDEL